MRTKKASVREVEKDPKYGSALVQRIINRSMKDGKKSVAQKQVYRALDIIADSTNKKPLDILQEAVEKITSKNVKECYLYLFSIGKEVKI